MKIFILIIFISYAVSIYSQQTNDSIYLDSLKKELSEIKQDCKVKYHVVKRDDNSISSHCLTVVYDNDSIGKKWNVGKAFSYYKNGALKVTAFFDINTHVIVDTAKRFRKDGSLQKLTVWSKDYDKVKEYSFDGSSYYHVDKYQVYWYDKKEQLWMEQRVSFDLSKNKSTNEEQVVYYWKKDKVFKKKIYKNGKLVEIINL
jgi:hypothetical protein